MTYRTERSAPATSALMEGVVKHPALERIRDARQSVGVRGDELPCATNPHAYDGTDTHNAEAAARACVTSGCPARDECYRFALDAVADGTMTRRDRVGQVYGGHVFGTGKPRKAEPVPDRMLAHCADCGAGIKLRQVRCATCRTEQNRKRSAKRYGVVREAAHALGLGQHEYRRLHGESVAVAEAIIAQHAKESAS